VHAICEMCNDDANPGFFSYQRAWIDILNWDNFSLMKKNVKCLGVEEESAKTANSLKTMNC